MLATKIAIPVGASCARDKDLLTTLLIPSQIYTAKTDNPSQPLLILTALGSDNNIASTARSYRNRCRSQTKAVLFLTD